MIQSRMRPHSILNQYSRKFLIVVLISLMLRLINLDQSLWLDEAAQAMESAGSFSGLLRIYADFMPPLFHIILYFWMKISHGEVWMRLLSVSFGIGTILFTYKIARQLFSGQIALLASLLLAISPFHIFYSQELRPYSLATFLATVSTYYLINFSFWPYTIASILLIYSLYTTPFLLLGHGIYLFLFIRKRLSHWIKAIAIVILSFTPWLPVFFRQLSGGSKLAQNFSGWSTAVSVSLWKAIPLTLAKFMLGRVTIDNKIIYAAVFLILLILVSYLSFKIWRKRKKETFILSIFLLIPVASVFFISFIIPVFAPQRLLFILPFFLILLAAGIESLDKKVKVIALTAVLLPAFYGVILYYTNPRFQREQWRQATAFVEEKADDKTEVLFAFPEPFAPFLWYREDETVGKGVVKNFVVDETDLNDLSLLLYGKNTIFLFQYLSELTDPQEKIPSLLRKDGFSLKRIRDFSGVGFIYEFQRT